ncbi:MAG: aminotransferase class V-fold PLP-dependent enzyme [Desulfobacteraceae bacterium]|nr:MAG: aminotransferase class V-fold PLP-dependent enzyme [Desulfobacteraceae bacterium]
MQRGIKRVKSSFEYLRKLFIMPDSPDKFIEFGRELLEMIHDFFQEKTGIHSSITLPELSNIFNQTSLPDSPQLIKDVLSEIKTKIIDHSVKVGSPYYIGHMTSAIPYFMILLEMIIAALNQNQVKIETAKASSFVERELLAWMHRLVFNRRDAFYERHIQNPRIALGNITSDGSVGNLTALFVAREKAFPPDEGFMGVRASGMHEALRHHGYTRGVVLVSTRGHYSIRKAANILGIGEENVVTIAVDSGNRMDTKKLKKKIKTLDPRLGGENAKIIAIVGIAGTTETGNIDRLDVLEEIAHEAGIHFHVDACWGGPALLVDEYRGFFKGIEKADSVTIDAHKLFYCPMSMGMVLFRSEKDLNTIRHSSQYIIRRNSVDTGRFTLEGSRPFACLKPWASLKIIGREGYGLLFKQARRNTDLLKKVLEGFGNFECLNNPELFILTYRFIPEDVKERLYGWKREPAGSGDKKRRKAVEKTIVKVNRLINAFTVKLHKALRRDDSTFVSRTTLESTRYRPQQIVVLRAVLINPLTTKKFLEQIVATQNRIALQLWQDFRPAYERMVEEVGGVIPSTRELPGAKAAHLL